MSQAVIEQLKAKDYEEALDFINMVFSLASRPTNFSVILPNLYQATDQHMSCHHVIREKGRIKALVGIYPGQYVCGDKTLSIARIGAVSTHPDARVKGYMSTLMNHVKDVIETSHYDIAYLGGARHRYLPFGFEKCGHQPVFHVTKRSLERGIGKFGDLDLSVCEGENREIEYFHALYESQKSYFKRDREAFHQIANHWYNTLLGIRRDGRSVGYLIASKDRKRIEEIVCERDDDLTSALASFFKDQAIDSCHVVIHPLAPDRMHRIFKISEDVSIHDRDNWSILRFERVLPAFMKVKHDMIPLVPATLIVEIEGHDTFEITVRDEMFFVGKSLLKPDISLSYPDAHRIFFGPLMPHQVIEIPSRLAFIEQWFPLPLFLSRPDYA